VLKKISSSMCFGGEVAFWQLDSQFCRTPMRFSTFLPGSKGKKIPAVMFLSGLTCTDENFMVKAGAQRLAADLGLALIVPDTSPREARVPGDDASWDLGLGAGFYVDASNQPWARHYQMASFVSRELPEIACREFNIDPARIGIMGHSMGGHGAIVTALRNPDRFKSCSAFAPICAPSQVPWGQKAFRAYLGENTASWPEWDSCALLESKAMAGAAKVPILVDQGTADQWLTQLRPDLLAATAEKYNWPVTVRMQEGYDHGYYFVATFIEEHLRHHADTLGG
jgi:S-formylglutathione hydrolase